MEDNLVLDPMDSSVQDLLSLDIPNVLKEVGESIHENDINANFFFSKHGLYKGVEIKSFYKDSSKFAFLWALAPFCPCSQIALLYPISSKSKIFIMLGVDWCCYLHCKYPIRGAIAQLARVYQHHAADDMRHVEVMPTWQRVVPTAICKILTCT